MSKYKVNINKPNPSDQEIDQFKDFDNMVNTYGEIHRPWYALKELYKGRKLIRLVIIIIAIALAVYVSSKSLNKTPSMDEHKPNSENIESQSFMVSFIARASTI